MARRRSHAIRKAAPETPQQIEARIVTERAANIGLPIAPAAVLHLVPATVQIERGGERGGGKTVRRLDTCAMLRRQGLLTLRQFTASEHFAQTYQTAGLNAGRAQNYGACHAAGSASVLPDGLHAVRARAHLDTIRSYLARDDERLLVAIVVLGHGIGKRDSRADRAAHASVLGSLCKALDRVAAAERL